MCLATVSLERLRESDVSAAVAIIKDGLAEHWGRYESGFNPDLEDFLNSYCDSFILVAKQDSAIVGTGVLQPTGKHLAQIVRMSVKKNLRRLGIGRLILNELIGIAAERALRVIILETTASWTPAIEFYKRHGFTPTHQQDGNQYFSLILNQS